MSEQRDHILNILQLPSNAESTHESNGKVIEDIEALNAGDL
jgi:hypothetical protein